MLGGCLHLISGRCFAVFKTFIADKQRSLWARPLTDAGTYQPSMADSSSAYYQGATCWEYSPGAGLAARMSMQMRRERKEHADGWPDIS